MEKRVERASSEDGSREERRGRVKSSGWLVEQANCGTTTTSRRESKSRRGGSMTTPRRGGGGALWRGAALGIPTPTNRGLESLPVIRIRATKKKRDSYRLRVAGVRVRGRFTFGAASSSSC